MKMSATGMPRSRPLTVDEIDKRVTESGPGNYVLGKRDASDEFVVEYTGRADDDLPARLKDHIGKYERFKFSYAASPKAAFEKECEIYHHFEPQDNDVHPDAPDGSGWKCPICSR